MFNVYEYRPPPYNTQRVRAGGMSNRTVHNTITCTVLTMPRRPAWDRHVDTSVHMNIYIFAWDKIIPNDNVYMTVVVVV